MRRIWLFTVILFVINCAILINSGCHEQNKDTNHSETPSKPNMPPPVIKFEETALDFGRMGPGTKSTKELKFQNKGQGILKITDIPQCCGISASVDKKQYAPDETGILKINFQAPGSIGTFEKELKVYSNDLINPKIIIKITSEVIQKVFWEPETIKLLLDEENAACPQLTVRCIDEREFAITGIRSTGNCVTADYNPTIKKTEHVLDLKVDMEKLSEQLNGEINVTMNHPEGNIAIIYFKVVQKYEISPNLLTLNDLIENEHRKKTIKVFSNYKEDFEIESTSSEKNTVKMIDYKKVKDGYEINIEIIPQSELKNEKRVIDTFYVNIKGEKPLVLKCYEYYKN